MQVVEAGRKSDLAIYVAIGGKAPTSGAVWTAPDGETGHYEGAIPHYTASFDAVLTLARDQCDVTAMLRAASEAGPDLRARIRAALEYILRARGADAGMAKAG